MDFPAGNEIICVQHGHIPVLIDENGAPTRCEHAPWFLFPRRVHLVESLQATKLLGIGHPASQVSADTDHRCAER